MALSLAPRAAAALGRTAPQAESSLASRPAAAAGSSRVECSAQCGASPHAEAVGRRGARARALSASSHVAGSTALSGRRHAAGRSGRGVSLARPVQAFTEQAPSELDDASGTGARREKVGVLLLNLGGPDTLDDVQPFLFNLFSDPDILRLPGPLRFLQKPLGYFISMTRAPVASEGYRAIGGGSPLRRITDSQAAALCAALRAKGQDAEVYVGMRYWHPFTEEAVARIKADGVQRLVVLPLYPQFSISTSGSSLRLLEALFRDDPYLRTMPHTVIPSWYQRPGYVQAMADLIIAERAKFADPDDAHIFFSAHGVPVSYVNEAGDPYKEEMEECVGLIVRELSRRSVDNRWTLAYQSRVGPVEWLQPYTDVTIKQLGAGGVRSLLAVPISFVSEHIETLEEIDVEYRELAEASGIPLWGRVPALGVNQVFIDDLAEAVLEALPYVGAMAASYGGGASAAAAAASGESGGGGGGAATSPPARALVPPGSVGDLLAAYDSERLELPAPMRIWQWGWTKSAETWNGRLAMLAVAVLLAVEAMNGRGLLQLGSN